MSEIQQIDVPFPELDNLRLRISAAPARLNLRPGSTGSWVTGTYNGPDPSDQAKVDLKGPNLEISHPRDLRRYRHGLPQFDLELGTDREFSLELLSGASDKNSCELGGLKLTRFACQQGAGQINISWSAPNQVVMNNLSIQSGASQIRVSKLANARSSTIDIESGAAELKIDFLGTLDIDMAANIRTGVADAEIGVDAREAIVIRNRAYLGDLKIPDGFVTEQGSFRSQAAATGKTPVLTLDLTTALGSIRVVDASAAGKD